MAFAVLAILGFTSQIYAQDFGYTLKEVSKFTEGLPEKMEARQAVLGKNGKIYIQNKSTKSVEVWTKEGKTAETLANSTAAVAIASDDAGNIIVPGAGSGWTTNFANVTSLKVFPANGGEAKEVSVAGLPAGRMDFMSHVAGNILSGEATMYLPANGSNAVTAVKFIDGVQEGDAASIPLSKAVLTADNATTTYGDATGFLYYKRNVKGGAHYVTVSYDELMGEFTAENELHVVTPGMYSSNGICKFTMGGVDYVAYNTGTGYYDGWAIVKCSDAKDNAVLVEHPQSMTNVTSGYQTNWLMVDVLNETTAMVYQYFPGGYFATYEFTAKNYPAEIYVTGNEGKWDPASPEVTIPMTSTPGLYEGKINVTSNNFKVSLYKGTWDDINLSCLGATVNNQELPESEHFAYHYGWGNQFTVQEGTYYLAADLKAKTVTIYPETVYVVGSLYQHNWATRDVPASTYEGNGKYSIKNVTIMPNEEGGQNMDKGLGAITFITNCSAEGDENIWEKPNMRPRYGAIDPDIQLVNNEAAKVARKGGDALNWQIETGSYDLALDLNNMTVVAKYITTTGIEAAEAKVATVIGGEGFIEVVGDAENVEVYTITGSLVSAGQKSLECAAGIYVVNVDGNVTKVVVR